jgi:methyltransferase
MAELVFAQRIEHVIRAYIEACNEADTQAIAACFMPNPVHYFPANAKWCGAATISAGLADRVKQLGECRTVDQLRVLRGVDWFVFEPQSVRIREIRSYLATQVQPSWSGKNCGISTIPDVDTPSRCRLRKHEPRLNPPALNSRIPEGKIRPTLGGGSMGGQASRSPGGLDRNPPGFSV